MYRAGDIPIQITVDGAVSDYINIIVYIVHRYTREINSKYSVLVMAGYETIDIVSDPGGIILVKWQTDETEDAFVGLYDLEIMGEITDADYDDNIFRDIAVEKLGDAMVDDEIKAEV